MITAQIRHGVLQQLEKNLSNLKVIVRDGKSGLDTAHKLAFQYAKNNKYTNFVSMDADLSHDHLKFLK